jgi:hypothetical protein
MTRSVRSAASGLGRRLRRSPRYSIYSELTAFRRKRENSVHFGGQECRPKRKCLLFSIEVQVPKLDVAGSSPAYGPKT